MAYQDFREFLTALEKEGQLLTVNEEVKPEPDLGAAARAASNLGDKSPALLFNNIYGYHNARIAMNVIGSWPNHAMMLGMPKDTPVKEQFLNSQSVMTSFRCRSNVRKQRHFMKMKSQKTSICSIYCLFSELTKETAVTI